MSITALIVAAGRGTRMGAPGPKALLPLGGATLLARVIDAFAAHPRVGPIIVVAQDPRRFGAALGPRVASRITLVRGGPERQDSVRLGLQAAPASDLTLVHDAARPLVPRSVIDAVIEAAERHGAAVPVVPVADTVKRLGADGRVEATLARDDLRLAQTPQGFRTELLRTAYARAEAEGVRATDDATLVERIGAPVMAVPGSRRNLKITTPDDLRLAEAWLATGANEEG
jgi:2-C-methyl-D-erythritol 4-phosphate cytidylyltransferase